MFKYTIVIEKANGNYSAYCPDIPGCIATGIDVEDTVQKMKAAIEFHLAGLRVEGLEIPSPATTATLIEVAV